MSATLLYTEAKHENIRTLFVCSSVVPRFGHLLLYAPAQAFLVLLEHEQMTAYCHNGIFRSIPTS